MDHRHTSHSVCHCVKSAQPDPPAEDAVSAHPALFSCRLAYNKFCLYAASALYTTTGPHTFSFFSLPFRQFSGNGHNLFIRACD